MISRKEEKLVMNHIGWHALYEVRRGICRSEPAKINELWPPTSGRINAKEGPLVVRTKMRVLEHAERVWTLGLS